MLSHFVQIHIYSNNQMHCLFKAVLSVFLVLKPPMHVCTKFLLRDSESHLVIDVSVIDNFDCQYSIQVPISVHCWY